MIRKKKVEEAPLEEEKIVETPIDTKPVFFENAFVTEVIDKNTLGFFHCKMTDGTTRHVPIELFN